MSRRTIFKIRSQHALDACFRHAGPMTNHSAKGREFRKIWRQVLADIENEKISEWELADIEERLEEVNTDDKSS